MRLQTHYCLSTLVDSRPAANFNYIVHIKLNKYLNLAVGAHLKFKSHLQSDAWNSSIDFLFQFSDAASPAAALINTYFCISRPVSGSVSSYNKMDASHSNVQIRRELRNAVRKAGFKISGGQKQTRKTIDTIRKSFIFTFRWSSGARHCKRWKLSSIKTWPCGYAGKNEYLSDRNRVKIKETFFL